MSGARSGEPPAFANEKLEGPMSHPTINRISAHALCPVLSRFALVFVAIETGWDKGANDSLTINNGRSEGDGFTGAVTLAMRSRFT